MSNSPFDEQSQTDDEDEYHQQISTLGPTRGRFTPEKRIAQDNVRSINLVHGANHLHLKPGGEYWVMNADETIIDISILVEIYPKYSNRFMIFSRPGEKLHLILAHNAPSNSEVCVSIFYTEESLHELILDKPDQFYVVVLPKHTYIIRTSMEDWLKSRYNFEVHAGRIVELDIDDSHIYCISAASGKSENTKAGFLFVNGEPTPV